MVNEKTTLEKKHLGDIFTDGSKIIEIINRESKAAIANKGDMVKGLVTAGFESDSSLVSINTYREFTDKIGKPNLVRINSRHISLRDEGYQLFTSVISGNYKSYSELEFLCENISALPSPFNPRPWNPKQQQMAYNKDYNHIKN